MIDLFPQQLLGRQLALLVRDDMQMYFDRCVFYEAFGEQFELLLQLIILLRVDHKNVVLRVVVPWRVLDPLDFRREIMQGAHVFQIRLENRPQGLPREEVTVGIKDHQEPAHNDQEQQHLIHFHNLREPSYQSKSPQTPTA